MGTRLDLVLTAFPSEPLEAVARHVLPLASVAPRQPYVVVSFASAVVNGVTLLASHLTGPSHPLPLSSELARVLSLRISPALREWYSDSTGEAGYEVFHNGEQVLRNDTPIPAGVPMFTRFQEGLHHAFPAWSELGPEEVLDVLLGADDTSTAFYLARKGMSLASPERRY